jgi:hypothetical protein
LATSTTAVLPQRYFSTVGGRRNLNLFLRRFVARSDIACALLAVTVALAAVLATISTHDGRLSVLVHMADNEPLATVAASDSDFAFVDQGAHYDGVYFYAIALDPIANGTAHDLIDRAAYRYGHPAYGWFARLVSLGRVELLPLALVALGLFGMFAAAALFSRLWTGLGLSPWGGLTVAFNPGLIYAVTVDASEPIGAALLGASLLAWMRNRIQTAGALMVVLCFVKEQLILVPVGLLVWETLRVRTGTTTPAVYRGRAAILLAGPLIYGVWYAQLHSLFGLWPFEQGQDILSFPLVGWLDSLKRASALATTQGDAAQIGQTAVPLLVLALAAVLLGVGRAVRMRSFLDPVYLIVAALVLCLGWLALMYPKDLIRALSFLGLLLPAVVADPRPSARQAE